MNMLPLPIFGIKISWDDDPKCASITSDLKEEGATNIEFNAAMDGIESLVLALFCSGEDVCSPGFYEAVETAVQACEAELR